MSHNIPRILDEHFITSVDTQYTIQMDANNEWDYASLVWTSDTDDKPTLEQIAAVELAPYVFKRIGTPDFAEPNLADNVLALQAAVREIRDRLDMQDSNGAFGLIDGPAGRLGMTDAPTVQRLGVADADKPTADNIETLKADMVDQIMVFCEDKTKSSIMALNSLMSVSLSRDTIGGKDYLTIYQITIFDKDYRGQGITSAMLAAVRARVTANSTVDGLFSGWTYDDSRAKRMIDDNGAVVHQRKRDLVSLIWDK
tara:strand:- start:492 stop:1256 length:765 start_codon:yes stop_codon:yes gene_type:complete